MKNNVSFFLVSFSFIAFLLPATAQDCYNVEKQEQNVVLIKCNGIDYQEITKIGNYWYWKGNRYNTWQQAANASCGC